MDEGKFWLFIWVAAFSFVISMVGMTYIYAYHRDAMFIRAGYVQGYEQVLCPTMIHWIKR